MVGSATGRCAKAAQCLAFSELGVIGNSIKKALTAIAVAECILRLRKAAIGGRITAYWTPNDCRPWTDGRAEDLS
jgi:hypothetical protein